MNLKEIKDIIALMNENDLAEIELERDGLKLKLRKNSAHDLALGHQPIQYSVQSLPSPQTSREPVAPGSDASKKDLSIIKSPMVGTFYRSPSPDAAPFIDVGQTVEVGQVVCIVEAMKLMNEIKSEVRGKVVEAAVDNAEPVEFGQPLYYVEPL